MNFLNNKFELDFTFSKIGWSYYKFSETTCTLRVLIFACSSVVRLSVKILDLTSPPKLLDGFTSNFQELILGSLYLQVLPLSVCLLKYLSGHLLQNYWMDWPMLASKYSVIASKYFVLVITYFIPKKVSFVSLSFIEIIRALSQGGRKIGGRAWRIIHMLSLIHIWRCRRRG